MIPIELVFALAAPALLVVAGVAKFRQREKTSKEWMEVAARHGLEPGPTAFTHLPILSGTVGGHAVELRVVRRSSGKSSVSHTVVQTRLSIPVPAGLKVTQDTLLGGLLTAMGGQDIPLADPRLDKHLKVQGRSPQAVKDLLDIGVVRQAMQRFFVHSHYTKVEGRAVIADRRGIQTGASVDEMLASTVALVTAMSEGRERAWDDLAQRHGLERSGTRTVRLSGEREGVTVGIESTGHNTILTVGIHGLDNGVCIHAGDGGFVGDDQILGDRVRITGPASALPKLFGPIQLDALRGELMQVFETWPDTELRDGRLEVTLMGEPFRQVDSILKDYRALAEALQRTVSGT
ncbi:MAG: hypothetical protein CL927_19820 [Deltaproteobacteria bacterium]|nr:hypothetical protein [Deltaproteobacteria bacterium]HCH61498.1 hypothetical protein [Deltaproteobacteria bacterium]